MTQIFRCLASLGLALLTILATGSMHVAAAQEIKLSHFAPTAHNHHANVIVPWVEEVKKRTNGRVEITVFPGASLASRRSSMTVRSRALPTSHGGHGLDSRMLPDDVGD